MVSFAPASPRTQKLLYRDFSPEFAPKILLYDSFVYWFSLFQL